VVRSDDPDDLVVLTRVDELVAAQLLRGRLEAEGIECFLPDEYMATQAWHLHGAIGGIRVQVHRADLERGKEILNASPVGGLVEGGAGVDAGAPADAGPANDDDGTISAGDRAAYRALRVALVSLWLMGLVHPYSLWLSLRALGRKDISAWGRSRAITAMFISLAGCAWMAFLVLHFSR
jgi:hypothetical protein